MRSNPRWLKKGWLASLWEYLGEIILSLLICILFFIVFNQETLHKTLCDLRGDLIIVVGALLAASLTVWGIFFAVLATEFGRWLQKKGEASYYSRGLASPAIGCFLGLLLLLFTVCSTSLYLVALNVSVLAYEAINFFTIIRNVNGLIGLWQLWEQNQQR